MTQVTHPASRDRVLELMERQLEGQLDEESRRWLDTHRGEFPDLDEALSAVDGEGEIWGALDGFPAPEPPADLDAHRQIRRHLDGEPVEALALEQRPRLGVIGVALLAVGLLLAGLGLRSDFNDQPWYQLVIPAALLIGGFVVAMISFDRLEQRGHRWLSMGVLVAAPALFVGVALMMKAGSHSHIASAFLGPAIGCGTVGLLAGLVVLVPAVVLARRGMAGPSVLGACLLGVTAASIGVGVLHLKCSIVDLPHVLVGHGLLFALVPITALLLRRVRRLA